MNDDAPDVSVTFRFEPRSRRANNMPQSQEPLGRIPRVTRLLALAIKLDGQIARGELRDYAEIARLGYVTPARVTQIMNLLNLAPDIQEALLHLPLTKHGRDAITERDLRPIAAQPRWDRQRRMWEALQNRSAKSDPSDSPAR